MKTLNDFKKAGVDIYTRLQLSSYPLSITYIKDTGEIPEGVYRPSKAKKKLSLCQAFTMGRRWGMPVAMTADDNFCTPATAFHGWSDITKDELIESQVRQGWHKDLAAETRRVESAWALLRSKGEEQLKEYCGFIVAPLKDAPLMPDTVLIYGDGVQVMHIIQAVCFEYKQVVHSFFEGFGESCVKGGLLPFLLNSPQVVIPGMGDRSFAAIGDNELAIGMPANMIFTALEDLFKTGGVMNLGYPARTMMPMDLTENITPGFKFLREKMTERKKP